MEADNDIKRRLAEEIDSKFVLRVDFVNAVNAKLHGKDKGITEQALSNIINGKDGFGRKNQRRFSAAGIDVDYVLTGRRKESTGISEIKQQYVREEVYTMAIPHEFGDDIEIEKTELGEKTQFTFYRLKKKDDYRETMRSAEPEFDAELPVPIPITDKQDVILKQDDKFNIPEFEDFGRAAATPKQPPSGRAFQEGQEP